MHTPGAAPLPALAAITTRAELPFERVRRERMNVVRPIGRARSRYEPGPNRSTVPVRHGVPTHAARPARRTADLLRGCHRRRLRSAISVYPPLGLSGSSASRLGGWPTKAGQGRPQRAIGTRTHDPRRTSSRQKRTLLANATIYRHRAWLTTQATVGTTARPMRPAAGHWISAPLLPLALASMPSRSPLVVVVRQVELHRR